MIKKPVKQLILLSLLSAASVSSFAWTKSFEVGYGMSRDSNPNGDKNSGALISADLFQLYHPADAYLSLNGSFGEWHSNASQNSNMRTVALSLSLRYYLDFLTSNSMYLIGTGGPAYLTKKAFGNQEEGSNFAFQWNAGVGMEFSSFDINFRVHDYIRRPPLAFNSIYLLSVGYLF